MVWNMRAHPLSCDRVLTGYSGIQEDLSEYGKYTDAKPAYLTKMCHRDPWLLSQVELYWRDKL